VGHPRAGLGEHAELGIVEPDAVGDHAPAGVEEAPMVKLVDGSPPETFQHLGYLELLLRTVRMDLRPELGGQGDGALIGPRRAVRKQRYWFNQEQAKVRGSRAGSTSAFRELALRTGGRFCYPPGDVLAIHKLAPYLSETADLFEEATAVPPKLVPIERIEVWTGGGRTWLRTEVDRAELARRGLGPASLPTRARHFGSIFKHVNTPEPTASYESKEAWHTEGSRSS
jgi:hypothetical protein